ncbi:MAG: hypothetical protein D6718_13730 [Acidobacteria bacterium]|nr:MAG: hypothetical protein D6718_13730 [Acidobacteriota bacterium]
MRGGRFAFALVLAAAFGAAAARGQVVRQITDEKTVAAGPGALDDAGTTLFTGSTDDPLGTNPDHAAQIFRFPAAGGPPVQLTFAPRGAAGLVSVSDDGQWVAFASPADLTGSNHDQSAELFVMRSDGTGLVQLTSDPAVNGGSVTAAMISGDGSRIAFVSNSDPLGENPQGVPQLFVIGRDGTNLRQLTHFSDGSFGSISISDDGTRLAFSHDGDPFGSNPDRGREVFTVLADGTNLLQITTTSAGYASDAPALSGDGTRIAFQSDGDLTGGNPLHQTEIFVVDWGGANLRQLTHTQSLVGVTGEPQSASPAITDDGGTIYFHSNHNTFFVNPDGNFEIFRIGADGSGLTALTDSLLSLGNVAPTVSGSGNRVAYFALGSSSGLETMDGSGGGVARLVTFRLVFNEQPDLSPDGAVVVFVRRTGLFGPAELYRAAPDGSGVAPVTAFGGGTVAGPSIAGDDTTVAFSSTADPLGTNADGSEEIFVIRTDGTGLRQLTDGPAGTNSARPAIARGGSLIVFDSDADLVGSNPQGARQIYAVAPDGTGLVQLTAAPAGTAARAPRVDAAGSWVVFESDADLLGANPDGGYEVFRVRSDGSGLEQLSAVDAGDARHPDISDDGARVAYDATGDPLGTNPEGNSEIYLYDSTTGLTRQLTDSVEGDSREPRLSRAGEYVYFVTDAPFAEADPDRPVDLYRVPASGGPPQRVGGLRAGIPGRAAPDESGSMAAFSGLGDFTRTNADLQPEIWIVDRNAPPELDVSRETPTVLRWSVISGPLRYDAIRGDVAALAPGDLGAVACLENDSPDNDTNGFGDPEEPAPGGAFFFLYRGSEGLDHGPGSYGRSSAGDERFPSGGDCPP